MSIAQSFAFVSGATILLSTVMVLTDHYNGTNYHKDKSKLASFKNMFYYFCAIAFAYKYQKVSHNKLIKVANKLIPVLGNFNKVSGASKVSEVTVQSAVREIKLLTLSSKQAAYYSIKELSQLALELESVADESPNYLF
jgi:Ni/Fe-hydrogenase subunit HybB-like protein